MALQGIDFEMRKGDIVRRYTKGSKGEVLLGNLSERLDDMKKRALNYYNFDSTPSLYIADDPHNPGRYAVMLNEECEEWKEYKVNWIVGDEASLLDLNSGSSELVTIGGEDDPSRWELMKRAEVSLQSGVEHLSEEELRASIEALRNRRSERPMMKKRANPAPASHLSSKDKKLNKVISGMSEEKRQELMKKLGMIE